MKIAITGNIGSGKSVFSSFAEKHGFVVLKADDISKEILSNDPEVRKKIIKEFGVQSFKNNKPDVKYLAKEVFSDPVKLNKIESILHPRVIKSVNDTIKNLEKDKKVVFVEAALIYEADMEKMFDYVVLITSDRNNRLQRKLNSGISEEDFIKRESNQIPEDEKRKRADFIFTNDGSIEDLQSKFNLLLITLGIK
ncbi:MAG TPA: dephospho-CoA kinase [Ignavibacteriaceae bacterium]|jgi:dephospho-CoA kinase|nr:MAG: Dephospho-CoA kinase [Ignavibacteria bacterium ADurb.Bin266]OQY75319.1 MAG: dephospho-CoA kinase [Ignavibacteriales bacterium UTCHB2]HQF43561.1 dephospho-CoA kinase [Ignavibacteriaceae bacterium]HQI41771.1 dephospho-CoA kinase [Ignavibacteriaceae bacterium]HQJ46883.1 dephospho-CoA kinase [Ignavibacteriaceae bacterium]